MAALSRSCAVVGARSSRRKVWQLTRANRWVVSIVVLLGLSGCTPDNIIYFQNNTDSPVHLRSRHKPGEDVQFRIPPNATTKVPLVSQGECTSRWLLYDENLEVVKDPGEMCWHDTVTIP